MKKYINPIVYKIIKYILPLFILVFVSFVFNKGFDFKVLSGDDLTAYQLFKSNGYWYCVMERTYGRFRPVSNFAIFTLFAIFGSNVSALQWCILIGFGLLCYLAFCLSYDLSHHYLLSLILSMFLCVSRYSWYNVTQMYGIMENMCIALVLAGIWFMYKFYKKERIWCFAASVASYLVLIFCHERYFLMLVPFVLFYAIHTKGRKRVIYPSVFVLAFLFYYVLKVYILKIGFASDTGGGTAVAFNFMTALKNALTALWNILAIPDATDYLVGIQFDNMGESEKILTVIIFAGGCICLATAVIVFIYQLYIRQYKKAFGMNFILLIAAAIMVGPAAVAQRLEMRFIYCSFVLLEISFCNNIANLEGKGYRLWMYVYLCLGISFSHMMILHSEPYYYLVQQHNSAYNMYESLYIPYEEYSKDNKLCYILDDSMDYIDVNKVLHQFEYDGEFKVIPNSDFKNFYNSCTEEERNEYLFISVSSDWSSKFFDVEGLQRYEKNDWIIGNPTNFQFLCRDTKIVLEYYVPHAFIGAKYTIYVDGEEVDKFTTLNEGVFTYAYENEDILNKFLDFTISLDDSDMPENYKNGDARELVIFMIYISCEAQEE